MQSKTRVLLPLYGSIGLLGVGFAIFYAAVLSKLSGGGPGDIGLALITVVLLLAQAGPAAGIPALVLHHRGDRPWSRPVKVIFGGLAFLIILVGLVFGSVMLPALATAGAGLFVASRLARMQRAWITVWILYSAACLVVDVVAAWFWWGLIGSMRH